jgi:hypothetical protein
LWKNVAENFPPHISNCNPSTSRRHVSPATGRLSQRAAWLLCVTISCMYNQCKGCSRGYISVWSLLIECYGRLCTPLKFCAMAKYEGENVYATGGGFVAFGSVWRHCEACVRGGGAIVSSVVVVCSTISPLSPHDTSREYSELRPKNAKKYDIWFLSLQQRNQLVFYVKMNCFHLAKFDNHSNKAT